ncbi:MAG: hypothetical protein H0U16_04715 [Actinobacteria bacterium]|nr:hypothetical protein [Actinomycetota bacterium]
MDGLTETLSQLVDAVPLPAVVVSGGALHRPGGQVEEVADESVRSIPLALGLGEGSDEVGIRATIPCSGNTRQPRCA